MMHRPWSSIVEVPYCFSRSNVKFQGHTALKIVKFYRNWAFLDSNSSLNSLMVMKCCTKLETAKERCPIVFQSHPSNFKVTRDKTSPLLTRIGRFRTIGRSQLSNPSDLPCFCLQDKTFGLKNKKGGKQQKFIKTVQQQVQHGNQKASRVVSSDMETVMLTLVMLNWFYDLLKYICVFPHLSTLRWHN